MTPEITSVPTTPRWINTEAGHRAWCEYATWRGKAAQAFSVQDRARLLDEAEQLACQTATDTVQVVGESSALEDVAV